MEEMGLSMKEMDMYLMELPMMIEHMMSRSIGNPKNKGAASKKPD
jgi:hypothetical protein